VSFQYYEFLHFHYAAASVMQQPVHLHQYGGEPMGFVQNSYIPESIE
jgi:hypothetical protein